MRFDVVIGNPPYQELDGGGTVSLSSKPLYNWFIDKAIELHARYISMIIPARWYVHGKGLDAFKSKMLNSGKISKLVNYCSSYDCFDEVLIAGGVCYFLWDSEYNSFECEYTNIHDGHRYVDNRVLNKRDVFVKYTIGDNIIDKVQAKGELTFDKIMSNRNPFGITADMKGSIEKTDEFKLACYRSFGEIDYFRESDVKNHDMVNDYKVLVGKLYNDKPYSTRFHGICLNGVIGPGCVCTETYNVLYNSPDKEKAENCLTYAKTKFARFLVVMAISGMNVPPLSYQFLPVQDFSHSWTDEMLYKKYGLTKEEIDFIETIMKPIE